MIDFPLETGNIVRQDSISMTVKDASIKSEYRLHKAEVRNPKDPEGNGITLWCLHFPQVNIAYVDETEELVFEAASEFFEQDFINFFAQKLVDEREKRENEV